MMRYFVRKDFKMVGRSLHRFDGEAGISNRFDAVKGHWVDDPRLIGFTGNGGDNNYFEIEPDKVEEAVTALLGEKTAALALRGITVTPGLRRIVIRGGEGSGHFGHEGRPGEVGGSQPGASPGTPQIKAFRKAGIHAATQALRVPRTEKWNGVRDALETIDSVHGIESVPLGTKVVAMAPTSQNAGHLSVERGPNHFRIKNMSLRILPEGETVDGIPQHLEFTVAHEFGHMLDWTAFQETQRSGGDWGDYDKPIQGSRGVWYLGAENEGMYGVMKAIKESEAYSALKVDSMPSRAWPGGRGELVYDYDTMKYLREPEELFARAYAQYVAVRSGDERMLQGVEDYRAGAKAGHPPMAWEDEDFQPIATAFDGMLAGRNWR